MGARVADLHVFTRPFTPRAVKLPGDMVALCAQYLAHLAARGYADATRGAYRTDLEQFAGYCAQRDITLVQHVTGAVVDDFLDALMGGEGCTHRTAARKRETLRGFFRYVIGRGVVKVSAAEQSRPVRFTPRRVVAPEAVALLRAIDAIPREGADNLRDRALFRLLLDGALRIGGALSLDVFDAQNPPECAVLPSGAVYYRAKGGAIKSTVIDDDTLGALRAWLAVRGTIARAGEPALFVSHRGTRITRAGAHMRLQQHAERVGLKLHCHLLRHRRLGDVMDRGDLRLANYLAGHTQLSTTANIYGHQATERLRARIRRDCPLGGGEAA